MARIQLQGYYDRFSEAEIADLARQLEDRGVQLAFEDDGAVEDVAEDLPGVALEEFLERLEPYEAAADIYLPVEFEGALKLYDLRLVSSHQLKRALRKIRKQALANDAPLEKHQKRIWRWLRYGGDESIQRNLVLDVDCD